MAVMQQQQQKGREGNNAAMATVQQQQQGSRGNKAASAMKQG
jgi:hypothetical protein